MKKIFLFFILTWICGSVVTNGQDTESPAAYMNSISNAQVEMNQKYMSYMSAVAHGRRARKVEKLRKQVLESIDNSRFKTIDLPVYKGDNSLRQSSIDYIKLCFNVFNEDYEKIVNMEDVAEQSYDEMQAYMLLREMTNKKIDDAVARMNEASRAFASKYGVNIVDSKNELDQKLELAGKLNSYFDKVFLIFFKCYWQNSRIVEAMNNGKLTEMEQARSSLIRFADEGLTGLDTLKNFDGDPSLAVACRNMLKFYRKTAQEDIPRQSDYFLRKENFEKMEKDMKSKSAKNRTNEDLDKYNKAVKEINDASRAFNSINQSMETKGGQLLNEWNTAQQKFADDHMPYYK